MDWFYFKKGGFHLFSIVSACTILAPALVSLSIAGCSTVFGGQLVDGKGGKPGRLIISNKGSTEVTTVAVSRCGGYSMGFNRLGEDEPLKVGEQKILVMSPGCWNVQLGGGGSSLTARAKIHSGLASHVDFK